MTKTTEKTLNDADLDHVAAAAGEVSKPRTTESIANLEWDVHGSTTWMEASNQRS